MLSILAQTQNMYIPERSQRKGYRQSLYNIALKPNHWIATVKR